MKVLTILLSLFIFGLAERNPPPDDGTGGTNTRTSPPPDGDGGYIPIDGGMTSKCSDGSSPGVQIGSVDNCYCMCSERNPDPQCKTIDDVKAALVDSSLDSSKMLLSAIIRDCADINTDLQGCDIANVAFDADMTTCQCPTCQPSNSSATDAPCDDSRAKSEYRCSRGECVEITYSCGTYTRVIVADDNTLCSEICGATGIDRNDTSGCIEGEIGSDGCYYACLKERDGSTYLSSEPLKVSSVLQDRDALSIWNDYCMTQNPPLAECPSYAIVPSDDRLGCGCGTCQDTCSTDERLIYFEDRDSGERKCVQYLCEETEEVVTAEITNPYSGEVTDVTYTNILKTESRTEVDVSVCTDSRDTTTTTTKPRTTPTGYDPCDDPCGGGRRRLRDTSGALPGDTDPSGTGTVTSDQDDGSRYDRGVQAVYDGSLCVMDMDTGTTTTFECAAALRCAARDDPDRYSVSAYGECSADTDKTDECILDDMIPSDRRSPTDACPLVCKCIENPRGAEFANVYVCDTLRRQFNALKEFCSAKLGRCTPDKMYFAECPAPGDADVCSALFCDESDVEEGNVTRIESGDSVCRRSSEGFATDVRKRDETEGCKYRECDEDESSPTYGELREVRYDEDTVTCRGIIDACPELADCRGVLNYETNGLCGTCPTCGRDEVDADNEVRCSRDGIGRGDEACTEDPRDDPTRPGNATIAGRVRLSVGTKLCADRLLEYGREEIYDKFKTSALRVARNCNISVADLRCAITGFNYEVVDRNVTGNDTCDPVVVVIIQFDFSHTELDALRELVACIDGLTDVRIAIADAITEETKNDRLMDNGDVDTYGVEAKPAESYAATVVLTDADGTEWIVEDMESTETPMDGTGATEDNTGSGTTRGDGQETTKGGEGNGANGYTLMFAVIASLMVFWV